MNVNPDLTVSSCLSLSFKSPKITDFEDMRHCIDYLSDGVDRLKWQRKLFDECETCDNFIGQKCHGSCLCRKIKHFILITKEDFRLYTQLYEDNSFIDEITNSIKHVQTYFGKQSGFEFLQFDNKDDLRLFSGEHNYPDWVCGFTSDDRYYQYGIIKDERRLIHEVCHLFIARIAKCNIPSWFNEGICEYIAFGDKVHRKLGELMHIKNLVPFDRLNVYDKILLDFDNSHPDNNIAYQQSASFVGYLIESIGFDKILKILSEKDFTDAFKKVIAEDMETLAARWESSKKADKSCTW